MVQGPWGTVMPIPAGEFQRLREEERRRALVHQQLRRERWRRRLPWALLGVATLLALALLGPSLVSFLLTLGGG
ncbi:MAG: hypothetical protein ACE5I9_00290 [Candidatus Methylomirabilales bacterium]